MLKATISQFMTEIDTFHYNKLDELISEMRKKFPSKEEQFNTAVHQWFVKEYPHVSIEDADAIKEIIQRENISIVYHKNYEFADIIRDGKAVMNFGDVTNVISDTIII